MPAGLAWAGDLRARTQLSFAASAGGARKPPIGLAEKKFLER